MRKIDVPVSFFGTAIVDGKLDGIVVHYGEILPQVEADLSEITKDPYNFDFVTVNCNYNERELKDALIEKVDKAKTTRLDQDN